MQIQYLVRSKTYYITIKNFFNYGRIVIYKRVYNIHNILIIKIENNKFLTKQ